MDALQARSHRQSLHTGRNGVARWWLSYFYTASIACMKDSHLRGISQ